MSNIPDHVAEQASDPDLDFTDSSGFGWHDWRNHVGERVAAMWRDIPVEIRLAIAADADEEADRRPDFDLS